MTVTNFDHKVVDRLAHELASVLDDRGIVMVNVTEVDNVERWRKAARRAGRLLGRPARTAISADRTNSLGQCWNDLCRRVSGPQRRRRPHFRPAGDAWAPQHLQPAEPEARQALQAKLAADAEAALRFAEEQNCTVEVRHAGHTWGHVVAPNGQRLRVWSTPRDADVAARMIRRFALRNQEK